MIEVVFFARLEVRRKLLTGSLYEKQRCLMIDFCTTRAKDVIMIFFCFVFSEVSELDVCFMHIATGEGSHKSSTRQA